MADRRSHTYADALPEPPTLLDRVAAIGARALLSLPEPALRIVAGRPIRCDGQQLAASAQLILRFAQAPADTPVEKMRALARQRARMLNAAHRIRTHRRAVTVPGATGELAARLYEPARTIRPEALLVFFHGGGWSTGGLDSHDMVCDFLAAEAGVQVLSVEYRLAPEDRFPAAYTDALTAYEHIVAHANDFGADPAAIAVGGDSAGGNLAAAVAQSVGLDHPDRRPAFLMLLYPALDAVERRPSWQLFGEGFGLTDALVTSFYQFYAPDPVVHPDPRLSPLRAVDKSALPPTYIATAGFDLLRDEGEQYGQLLQEAGVPVQVRRHADLYHGFANQLGIESVSRDAVAAAAAALRAGLAMKRSRPPTD
ncbi:MAG: alpha/beta hydrolase [Nocardiaceae bacterium]|nr:alpha/beta hydrolase [Nocardiaceae bacterium]